jgi:hypothetical protein
MQRSQYLAPARPALRGFVLAESVLADSLLAAAGAVPAMNATGDGKMDWFFRQWVYGTEVPRYVVDLKMEPDGEGVRVRGTISQQEVSAGFRALLPLYLEFDKGQFVRFALVPMIGATTVPIERVLKTPKKPRRLLVNLRSEVLARD